LADHAGLAPNTVSRFENGLGTNVTSLKQIQTALEEAGIVFIPGDSTAGPGIRLKQSREDD
jgi:hypothetical protein